MSVYCASLQGIDSTIIQYVSMRERFPVPICLLPMMHKCPTSCCHVRYKHDPKYPSSLAGGPGGRGSPGGNGGAGASSSSTLVGDHRDSKKKLAPVTITLVSFAVSRKAYTKVA